MSGWMFLPETKLENINKFAFFKECIKPTYYTWLFQVLCQYSIKGKLVDSWNN